MKSLNYKSKTFKTIFYELLTIAYNLGLLSSDEKFLDYVNNREDIDNMYVLFLSVYATEITSIYGDMDLIYAGYDVKKATGIDLDIIGEKFGIPRPAAQKSEVELQFTLNKPITSDITIPIGSQVSTSMNDIFYTIEEAVLIAGNTNVKCEAKSVATGYNSRVEANELTLILFENSHGLTVTNLESSSGGTNVCLDDDYRLLIQKWAYSHNRGTKEAYELFFEYYEGLDGYRLIPLWDGTGTLKVVLDPGTDYMISNVTNLLKENVEMFDDDVLVVAATKKNVDVNATVNVDIDSVYSYSAPEKEDIKLRIINNIKIYIDGGYKTNGVYYPGLTLGEDFIPHKCSVFLDQQINELKSISFSSDYISVAPDEKAVSGIINVTIQ